MFLILLIVGLVIVKYLDLPFMANVSWWWIVLAMVLAFVWFEVVERLLGLDKNKMEHDALEKARAERVKKAFDTKKK